MLVLAAFLHLIVLLGVTFVPEDDGRPSAAVEVLLVGTELPEARDNPEATYLAQRSQQGAGNTQAREATRLRRPADPGGELRSAGQAAAESSREEARVRAAATAPRATVSLLPLAAPVAGNGLAEARSGNAATPGSGTLPAEADLRLRGPARDELEVTPDTRLSVLAPYLDGWRQRVERIGTVNYPASSQFGRLSGSPVIEVSVDRAGRLVGARVRRSSGHPTLDAAALDILRLATPFEPFPPTLAQYRVLHFAYEWQFKGGGVAQGSLQVP
jgi:protein TonB